MKETIDWYWSDYYNSPEWEEKRKAALDFYGHKCTICGTKDNLRVHHKTYSNFMNENMEDLTVLCDECHHNFHLMLPGNKQNSFRYETYRKLRETEKFLYANDFFGLVFPHEIINGGFINLSHLEEIKKWFALVYNFDIDQMGIATKIQAKINPIKHDEVVKLHLSGYTDAQIHEITGISKTFINKHRRNESMKPIDLSNVQEAGSGVRLPAGGYICRIGYAEDKPDKSYILVQYDIAEGEFANYYADRQKANPTWAWGGTLYKSYKQTALPMFKRFCSCVTKSNPGYLFDGNTNADEKTLAGKLIGLVLAEEEYIGNDGTVRTRLYVSTEKPVDDIRAGRFKVPDKKTVAPIGEFSDISSGDDSELPFS